jgi:hypothetical protein
MLYFAGLTAETDAIGNLANPISGIKKTILDSSFKGVCHK